MAARWRIKEFFIIPLALIQQNKVELWSTPDRVYEFITRARVGKKFWTFLCCGEFLTAKFARNVKHLRKYNYEIRPSRCWKWENFESDWDMKINWFRCQPVIWCSQVEVKKQERSSQKGIVHQIKGEYHATWQSQPLEVLYWEVRKGNLARVKMSKRHRDPVWEFRGFQGSMCSIVTKINYKNVKLQSFNCPAKSSHLKLEHWLCSTAKFAASREIPMAKKVRSQQLKRTIRLRIWFKNRQFRATAKEGRTSLIRNIKNVKCGLLKTVKPDFPLFSFFSLSSK